MPSDAPLRPSAPSHILETCLYVRDMTASTTFYTDILGLTPHLSSPRLTMFPLGSTTLILFQLGMTESDSVTITGVVPGHGPDEAIVEKLMGGTPDGIGNGNGNVAVVTRRSHLHTHYCLAVASPEEVDAWHGYLIGRGVVVRGVMGWERGGKSVYFEDPDGHVGEIGSRGIWGHW